MFVVGCSGADWRYPASVLFEPGCLPGDTPPRRIKGTGVARSLTASTGGASGKEQHQTFISGDGRPLNALGVSGLVMDTEFWNGEDVSTTLTEAFADDRMPDKGKMPCVICRAVDMANAETGVNVGTTLLARQYKSPPFVFAHETGRGYCQDGDIAGTLRKAGESGTAQVPELLCVHGSQDPIVQADHANAIGRNNGAENCVCQYGDVAGTLTARHDSSPCADRGMSIVYENHAQDSRVKPCGECSPQINAKAGTGGGNLPIVLGAFTVRRLTPVECERLMGFPDNWTRIPWRRKPAEDCPDSPRYKACGNSMCVNVMRWIGMRIEYVERKINIKVGEK